MPETLPPLSIPIGAWLIFFAVVALALGADLFIAGKGDGKVKLKEALIWSAVWISLAVGFGLGLGAWPVAGPAIASQFAAGYVLELSLSVDNLFVFILIFTHYKVPEKLHRKVLLWGVFGAIVLRAIFIALGAVMVSRFQWMLILFGVFLAYTGIKLMFHKDEEIDPAKSPIIRLANRFLRVTTKYHGADFFVRIKGVLWSTPLLVIVLVVEATDLLFAVDSIPAVFGVTKEPFVVYTSNIFAIMGLRSMFFALEGVMHLFRFLKQGLSVILTLIGAKLMFLEWLQHRFNFHVGEYAVLLVIALILAASVAASVMIPVKRKKARAR